MYEESLSHCPISVTKFPFDEQRCQLIYESWKYNSSQLNITSTVMSDSASHYQESEQWKLLGKQPFASFFLPFLLVSLSW